jgi:hypothetical protein
MTNTIDDLWELATTPSRILNAEINGTRETGDDK